MTSSPADLIREDGTLIYPLLLLLLATPAVAVLLAIPYAVKQRFPAAVYVLLPAGLVVVGALATLYRTLAAVFALEFELAQCITKHASVAWAEAQTTLEVGMYCAAVAATATALLCAPSVSVGAGKEAVWCPGEALVTLAVGMLFAFAALVYGASFGEHTVVPALVLGVGAVALAVASLRRSEGPPDLGRVAEGRLAIAALVVVAVLCAWEAARLAGWQQALRSTMLPDCGRTLVYTESADAHGGATWTGAIAVVGAFLSAIPPIHTSSHGLLDRRGAFTAASLAVVLLGSFGSFGLASWRSASLWDVMQGGILADVSLGTLPEAKGIDGQVVGTALVGSCMLKPEGAGWSQRSLYRGLRRACADDWTPVTEPIRAWEDLLLAVPPALPASRLSTWQWDAGGRDVYVLIDRNQPDEAGPLRLGSMPFSWTPKIAAPSGEASSSAQFGILHPLRNGGGYAEDQSLYVIEGRNGTTWGFNQSKNGVYLQELKTRSDLSAALDLVKFQSLYRPTAMTLVPGSSWTVGDLVKWCATALDPEIYPKRFCALSEETSDELGKRLNVIWPWQPGHVHGTRGGDTGMGTLGGGADIRQVAP